MGATDPVLAQKARQDQSSSHAEGSKEPPMSAKPDALSLSDALGLSQLAMDAADGLTALAEHLHMSILETPGIAPRGQGATGDVTRLVYRSVSGANRLTGAGVG